MFHHLKKKEKKQTAKKKKQLILVFWERRGRKWNLSITKTPKNNNKKKHVRDIPLLLWVRLHVHGVQLASTGEYMSFLLNFRIEITWETFFLIKTCLFSVTWHPIIIYKKPSLTYLNTVLPLSPFYSREYHQIWLKKH